MPDSIPDPDSTDDYDEMLEQLDNTIDGLLDDIKNGRIRDTEKEKVRIQQYKALGYLIRTKQNVLEDKTLTELSEEIEALKESEPSARVR